jgi:hypothetical protein
LNIERTSLSKTLTQLKLQIFLKEKNSKNKIKFKKEVKIQDSMD